MESLAQQPVSHTPGPWSYDRMYIPPSQKDRRSGFVVNGPLPEDALEFPVRICDLRAPRGMDGFAEGAANARLIAAAPELLELCRRTLQLLSDPTTDDFDELAFATDLEAVIAKATGHA